MLTKKRFQSPLLPCKVLTSLVLVQTGGSGKTTEAVLALEGLGAGVAQRMSQRIGLPCETLGTRRARVLLGPGVRAEVRGQLVCGGKHLTTDWASISAAWGASVHLQLRWECETGPAVARVRPVVAPRVPLQQLGCGETLAVLRTYKERGVLGIHVVV